MKTTIILWAALSILALPASAQHQGKKGNDSGQVHEEKKKQEDSLWIPKITHHSVTIHGQTIHYTAKAGYMPMKNSEGKVLARMFYIAYIKDGVQDKHTRAITYAFNGGPGSASVWLHMGAVGPQRVVLDEKGVSPAPPYHLQDNANSWLDQTDLVFIDPIPTGYSRVEKGQDPGQFRGYGNDIRSVGDFIRLYTTRNDRWNSPKFILGESYGTTRAAGLSGYLQQNYNMYLNGIILVSSVLDFQTLSFDTGNDLPYIFFLPTYATSAWYYKRLSPELQAKTVEEVADEVKKFAEGAYAHALFEGNAITAQEKKQIIDQLHAYTSLPEEYLQRANMRIPARQFFKLLLRDSAKVIGRYDSRFSGDVIDPLSNQMVYDPSDANISGSFVGAFNDYVRNVLKFKTDENYDAMANVWPWDYSRNQYLNVAPTLHEAMTKNRYLRTWVVCGYYDLATPFAAAQYVVDHMGLSPAQRQRIHLTYYKAGHMVYISKNTIAKLHEDAVQFYTQVLQ
jgi:carboxypeptidase C (cathepsin A)